MRPGHANPTPLATLNVALGPRLVVAIGAKAIEHAAVRGHALEPAEAGLAQLQERGRRQQRVRPRLPPPVRQHNSAGLKPRV